MNNSKMSETKRGGTRPGAGRKPNKVATVQMVVMVQPTTKTTVERLAATRSMNGEFVSKGQIVDEAVAKIRKRKQGG